MRRGARSATPISAIVASAASRSAVPTRNDKERMRPSSTTSKAVSATRVPLSCGM